MHELRRRRKAMGYTQVALAKLVGVSKMAICQYEKGRSTPSMHVLVALACTLGCSADQLLGQEPVGLEARLLAAFRTLRHKQQLLAVRSLEGLV